MRKLVEVKCVVILLHETDVSFSDKISIGLCTPLGDVIILTTQLRYHLYLCPQSPKTYQRGKPLCEHRHPSWPPKISNTFAKDGLIAESSATQSFIRRLI